MKSGDYAYEERMGICIHDGGLAEHEAQVVASAQTGRTVPHTREQAMKLWMETAMARLGRDTKKAAQRLVKHHGVSTMEELTVDQLMASVERMSEV
jgi:cobalamin biosynthesis protein CobT